MSVNKNKLDYRVLFFIPNIIGYLRVIGFLIALYLIELSPLLAFISYGIAAFLDAIDGVLARRLNQISRFGTILDFIVDRFCQMGLLVYMALYFREYWYVFVLILALDMASHFAALYKTAYMKTSSHKDNVNSSFSLLNRYYSSRVVLFSTCAFYELFLGMLLGDAVFSLSLSMWLYIIPGFGFCLKVYIHILQLLDAMAFTLRLENSN